MAADALESRQGRWRPIPARRSGRPSPRATPPAPPHRAGARARGGVRRRRPSCGVARREGRARACPCSQALPQAAGPARLALRPPRSQPLRFPRRPPLPFRPRLRPPSRPRPSARGVDAARRAAATPSRRFADETPRAAAASAASAPRPAAQRGAAGCTQYRSYDPRTAPTAPSTARRASARHRLPTDSCTFANTLLHG